MKNSTICQQQACGSFGLPGSHSANAAANTHMLDGLRDVRGTSIGGDSQVEAQHLPRFLL
jgi:hypothetical protein